MSVLKKLSEIFLKPDDVSNPTNTDEQLERINSSDLPEEIKKELTDSLKGIQRNIDSKEEQKEQFYKALKAEKTKEVKIKSIEKVEQEEIVEEKDIQE